jgi:hypothetical protein
MVLAVIVFVLLLAGLAFAAGAFGGRAPLSRTRRVVVTEPVREVVVERPVRETVVERRVVDDRDPLL